MVGAVGASLIRCDSSSGNDSPASFIFARWRSTYFRDTSVCLHPFAVGGRCRSAPNSRWCSQPRRCTSRASPNLDTGAGKGGSFLFFAPFLLKEGPHVLDSSFGQPTRTRQSREGPRDQAHARRP